MRVVSIGAGNVATLLTVALQQAGLQIVQVYSRTSTSARLLADRLGCGWTTSLDDILPDAGLYLFSVKDAVLADVIARVEQNDGLWVHTSGSMPMSVFERCNGQYGVMYPLQTFTKARGVSLEGVPIFVEAVLPEDQELLCSLGGRLSGNVEILSSEKRKVLHLAAVFACNFTNHLYALAGKLLEGEGLSPDLLLPLIDETAAKIHQLPPAEAQTGPAVRYDENVINKHLAMLSDPDMKAVYQLLSRSIYKEAKR